MQSGSSILPSTPEELEELKKITSLYKDTNLPGSKVIHGTNKLQMGRILEEGPKELRKGIGGAGLNVTQYPDVAITFAPGGSNKVSTMHGPSGQQRGVLMIGHFNANPEMNYRVTRVEWGSLHGKSINPKTGIFPPNWAIFKDVQDFINQNSDIIHNIPQQGYHDFFVIRESAGPKVITWEGYQPLLHGPRVKPSSSTINIQKFFYDPTTINAKTFTAKDFNNLKPQRKFQIPIATNDMIRFSPPSITYSEKTLPPSAELPPLSRPWYQNPYFRWGAKGAMSAMFIWEVKNQLEQEREQNPEQSEFQNYCHVGTNIIVDLSPYLFLPQPLAVAYSAVDALGALGNAASQVSPDTLKNNRDFLINSFDVYDLSPQARDFLLNDFDNNGETSRKYIENILTTTNAILAPFTWVHDVKEFAKDKIRDMSDQILPGNNLINVKPSASTQTHQSMVALKEIQQTVLNLNNLENKYRNRDNDKPIDILSATLLPPLTLDLGQHTNTNGISSDQNYCSEIKTPQAAKENYESIVGLVKALDDLQGLNPKSQSTNKGNILGDTLQPISNLSTTESNAKHNPLDNLIYHNHTIREGAKIQAREYNNKLPPMDIYKPDNKTSGNHPKFSLEISGGTGAGLAAAGKITFDFGMGAGLPSFTSLIAPTVVGAGALIIGFAVMDILQTEKRMKYEEHLDKVISQTNFVSFEIKKGISKYKKFLKLCDKYNSATGKDKAKYFDKALRAWNSAIRYENTISHKYGNIVTDKHGKITVIERDGRDAAIHYFAENIEYKNNPRLSAEVNARLKKKFEKRMEKIKNKPPLLVKSRHRTTKETKKHIESNLPLIEKIKEDLNTFSPNMLNNFYINFTIGENILENKLNAATNDFIAGIINLESFHLILNEINEMRDGYKQQAKILSAMGFVKPDDSEALKGIMSACDIQQINVPVYIQSSLTNKTKLEDYNKNIDEFNATYNAHYNYLANLEELTKQYKNGLIKQDEYIAKCDTIINAVKRHNTLATSIKGSELSTLAAQQEITKRILTTPDDNYASRNINLNDFNTRFSAADSLIRTQLHDLMMEYVAAKDITLEFQEKVAAIYIQIAALKDEADNFLSNPSNSQEDNHDIKNIISTCEIWLQFMPSVQANKNFNDTTNLLNLIYNNAINERDMLTQEFRNGKISEEIYKQKCSDIASRAIDFKNLAASLKTNASATDIHNAEINTMEAYLFDPEYANRNIALHQFAAEFTIEYDLVATDISEIRNEYLNDEITDLTEIQEMLDYFIESKNEAETLLKNSLLTKEEWDVLQNIISKCNYQIGVIPQYEKGILSDENDYANFQDNITESNELFESIYAARNALITKLNNNELTEEVFIKAFTDSEQIEIYNAIIQKIIDSDFSSEVLCQAILAKQSYLADKDILTRALIHYHLKSNDVTSLTKAFNLAKTLKNTDERAHDMLNSLISIETINEPERSLAMKYGDADALKLMETDKWLDVLKVEMLKRDELNAIANSAPAGENAEVVPESIDIQNLLNQNDEIIRYAINIIIRDTTYEKTKEDIKNLNHLSYAHLGVDIIFKLVSARIKKHLDLKDAESIKYVEQTVKTLDLANQLGVHSFAIGNAYFVNNIKIKTTNVEDVIKQWDGLTEEKANHMRAVMAQKGPSGLLHEINQFFEKNNNKILYTKLTVAIFDLMIYRGYVSYQNANNENQLSFEEWFKADGWTKYPFALFQQFKNGLYALTMGQIISNLIQLSMSGLDPLTLTRKGVNTVLSIPYFVDFLDWLTNGEEFSTNKNQIMMKCFFANMFGNDIQQILNTHDETILNGMGDILRHNHLGEVALLLGGYTGVILNAYFMSKITYSFYRAVMDSDDIVNINRIKQLENQIQLVMHELTSPSQKINGCELSRQLASLYCDLKYAALHYGNKYPEHMFIYTNALLMQHNYEKNIEPITYSKDGNGFFNAVSCYTDESAVELRKMTANYIKRHIAFFSPFVSESTMVDYLNKISQQGTYADELILRALSKVLNRPILIVYTNAGLDFQRQGLKQPEDIIKGNPIYVLYDAANECYHGFKMRSEYYFEKQLSQKYSQEIEHKAIIDKSNTIIAEVKDICVKLEDKKTVRDQKIMDASHSLAKNKSSLFAKVVLPSTIRINIKNNAKIGI